MNEPPTPNPRVLLPSGPLDVAIPPGDTLWELVEEKQLNLVRLMSLTGLRPGELERFFLGKKRVTPGLAWGLEAATGTPARLWVKLQKDYDETKKRLGTR